MRRGRSAVSLFLRWWHADLHRGFGKVRPSAAAHDTEQTQQLHRFFIGLCRSGNDRTVLDHPVHYFLAEFGTNDAQRPVVVFSDTASGNVGVLGGEVRTHLASFACPLVALLQIDLVERTITHPDLERTLDVHLHHVFLAQAVFGKEQLLEDGVVERLGAQETDVEEEWLADFSGFAFPHDGKHR